MSRKKLIIIGGGVGPAAGVKLHEIIIQNTLTDGTDQDHIEVHHYSRSEYIGDRTLFLFGKKVPSPSFGMMQTIKIASLAARAAGKKAVAGVPCNTFHAPVIWNEFMTLLKKEQVKIKMVHMLNETFEIIHHLLPKAKRVGLMSTTGTRKVKVYQQLFERSGIEIIQVPEILQPQLHDSIYNTQWGIKAVSPVTDKARHNFKKYVGLLAEQKVEAVILGCTEIPLALPQRHFMRIPLIDPMQALARALIREADPTKLKPLTLQ